MSESEHEDVVADLLGDVWLLYAEKFDPERGLEFGSYAAFRLRGIILDRYFRKQLGRDGQRAQLRNAASLEELADADRLDEALAEGTSDPAALRALDLQRVLADRSPEVARAREEVAAEAASSKATTRLLAELRAELVAISEDFDAETDELIERGERLFTEEAGPEERRRAA